MITTPATFTPGAAYTAKGAGPAQHVVADAAGRLTVDRPGQDRHGHDQRGAGLMAGRSSLAGKQFVVTGAASGIGAAVAEQLGAAGAVLHLTDRNAEGLKEVRVAIEEAGGTVATATAADVASIDEVRAFADEVHAGTSAVDGVLNIAGIAIWGTVDKMAHEQWRAVIEINLMGPIHVIESFVPAMIANKRGGHLVNVSSAAGLVGLPWHAAYSASKFGLRGLSEVLRFDLARHRIGVTLVTPGAVATPLTGTVQVAGVDTSTPQFQKMRGRFEHRAVSAETAASKIIDGMLSRRYLVHTSRDIQALHAVQRYVPPAYSLIMHGMNRVATRVGQAAAMSDGHGSGPGSSPRSACSPGCWPRAADGWPAPPR